MGQPFLKARVKRETIPRLYRLIAPFHDGLALLVETEARDYLIDSAEIQNGETVLEVGVGTGLNFNRIVGANPGGMTIGVDITPAMIKKAKHRIRKQTTGNFDLRHGDAYALPFDSDSVDLVVNSYMFDLLSVSDMSKVLGEFYRVLRPGGRLALAYMAPGEKWYEKTWDTLYRIHPFIFGGCRGVTAIPYLESCGFDLVATRRISYRTFPSEVVIATAR